MRYWTIYYSDKSSGWIKNVWLDLDINEAHRSTDINTRIYPQYRFMTVEVGTDLTTIPKPEGVR